MYIFSNSAGSSKPLYQTGRAKNAAGDVRYFVVKKNLTDTELGELKLRIFRRVKGTIRPFFVSGSVKLDTDNEFTDIAAAETANFIFPLERITDLKDYPQSVVKFDTLTVEFLKILKKRRDLPDDYDGNPEYIGYVNDRKGIYPVTFPYNFQSRAMYTLYAALINKKQIVSNLLLIRPYWNGERAVIL